MRSLCIVLFVFLFSGCGNDGNPFVNKERVKQSEIELLKIQSEQELAKIAAASQERVASFELEKVKADAASQEKIATIEKEQAVELKQIESSTSLSKIEITKELALEEIKNERVAIENSHKTSTSVLVVIAVALALLFIYLFYTSSRNRKERLRKHENELMLKLQLKEQEVKMKMAQKVLDSITSGKLTPEQENRLVQTLENTTTKLIGSK